MAALPRFITESRVVVPEVPSTPRFWDVAFLVQPAGGGRQSVPGFTGQVQALTEWCWAAVAASIDAYHSRRATPPRVPRTQCQIAQATDAACVSYCLAGGPAGRGGVPNQTPSRCGAGDGQVAPACASPAANHPDDVLTALMRASINYQPSHTDYDGGTRDAIRREIPAGRPVVIKLAAEEGDQAIGHFKIIYGYFGSLYMVFDPGTGLAGDVNIKDLGDWTQTVTTGVP